MKNTAFDEIGIRTFKAEDLVGRNLDVKSSEDSGIISICATDTKTGEIFVLSERTDPIPF